MFSFWEQQSFTNYHYAIIGGGLVGISTALSIKELHPASEVAVFERGIIPYGASTRNAGFACFGSLSELLCDIDAIGLEKTRQLVMDRWSGLQLLRKRVGDTNLEYQNHGGYELLFEKDLWLLDKLDYVNELLTPIFDKPVFTVNNQLIRRFGLNNTRVVSLIQNPFEGQLHAGAMMKSLIALARERGINCLTGARVKSLHQEGDSVSLTACAENADIKFKCRRAAVCTNAFANSLLPDLEIKPGRGTVLITQPVKKLKFKGVFHYHQGYYYFRNLGSRVIFGGGRNLDFKGEETFDFGFNERIVEHLKNELGDLILPHQPFEIDQQWSGIMAFGQDKRPLVGLQSPAIGYAVRLGGMGVALGSMVGHQLAKLICFYENC